MLQFSSIAIRASFQALSLAIMNKISSITHRTEEKAGQNEQLRPLFTIPTSAPAVDIFTRNSRLFLVTANSIIECGTDGKVREHLLQTMDTEDSKPVAICGEETDKFYAAKGNMIFTNTNRLFAHPDKWEYAFTLPFPAYDPSAIAVHKNRIVYSTADSIYYYDLSSHQKQVTTMQALLDEFREHPIETVTFSQGANDCFMNYSNSLIYMRKNNLFRPLLGNKKNSTIEPATQTLDEAKIKQFVSDVCLYHNRQPVMTDTGFSEADYQQSKKDIIVFRDAEHTLRNYLKFYRNNSFYFSRNNIDFNRLISTVDSVKLMDSVTLNRALRNSDGLHSYSTTWIDVALKNKSGDILTIMCRHEKTNKFYTLWTISINGSHIQSSSPAITAFFADILPSLFTVQDKIHILHELVKYSYK